MSLIDQRILIAAPAEAVWAMMTSPATMPRWHKGCKQISILSTRVAGIGTRRRITDDSGQSQVEEITHWLENLGYEYVQVDGPYRSYRARVRFQPVPEGTIVNWVVDYQIRGALRGLRDRFVMRRRISRMMSESLKQLRRLVEQSGARIDPNRQARFAMRSAPSVEARAALAAEITEIKKQDPDVTVASVPAQAGIPTLTTSPVSNISAPATSGSAPKPSAIEPPPPSKMASGVMPILGGELPVTPSLRTGSTGQMPTITTSTGNTGQMPAAKTSTGQMPAVKRSTGEMPAVTGSTGQFAAVKRSTGEMAKVKTSTGQMPAAQGDPDQTKVDTKPRKPKGLAEAIAAQQSVAPTADQNPPVEPHPPVEPPKLAAHVPSGDTGQYDPSALTVPVNMVAPPPPPQPETQTMPIVPAAPPSIPEMMPTPLSIMLPKRTLQDTPTPSSTSPILPASPIPDVDRPSDVQQTGEEHPHGLDLPPPTGMQDTGEISIWRAFGVTPPSEKTRTDLATIISSLFTPPGSTPPIDSGRAMSGSRIAIKRRASIQVRSRKSARSRLQNRSGVKVRSAR